MLSILIGILGASLYVTLHREELRSASHVTIKSQAFQRRGLWCFFIYKSMLWGMWRISKQGEKVICRFIVTSVVILGQLGPQVP